MSAYSTSVSEQDICQSDSREVLRASVVACFVYLHVPSYLIVSYLSEPLGECVQPGRPVASGDEAIEI